MKIPIFAILLGTASVVVAQSRTYSELPEPPTPGDRMASAFFELETNRVDKRTLANIETAEDWKREKVNRRRELFEMLGLQPLPARSPLKPKITGTTELPEHGIVVENVVFQSRPGLYVTGNIYRPTEVAEGEKLPTVLYVCGHGPVKEDGISYGNKAYYQHHGAWFAKHGYVCLTIDTLQLGEIEGFHHGTNRGERWWWTSRGYTPAGVEAWNCIRALDYLETRSEVDAKRIGVTGRSGGGAYSWWVAALDERIAAAAPVAGITSMHNHVVDGAIEGHCDCMFMVNTYRWDFPLLSSLVAPRPLLIANTDNDRIFPLDGVVDIHQKTRKVYELLDAEENLGLAILEGPHKDTQALRTPVFEWFERHLKGVAPRTEMADTAAPQLFDKTDLRVFSDEYPIPENERNTAIDDYFTRRTPRTAKPPASRSDWEAQSVQWMRRLQSRSFRAWPAANDEDSIFLDPVVDEAREGLRFRSFDFVSQEPFLLPLYLVHREGLEVEDLDLIVLNVLDEETWPEFLSGVGAAFPAGFRGMEMPELDGDAFSREKEMHEQFNWGMAYVAPRGIGASAWTSDPKERNHLERRFYLLGMTVDSARVWDIRNSIQALRSLEGATKPQLWLQSSGVMAGNTLYASLFEPPVHRLDLHNLPTSHREGPHYLNVLRYLDIPQALSLAADRVERCVVYGDGKWNYVEKTGEVIGWGDKRFEMRESQEDAE